MLHLVVYCNVVKPKERTNLGFCFEDGIGNLNHIIYVNLILAEWQTDWKEIVKPA